MRGYEARKGGPWSDGTGALTEEGETQGAVSLGQHRGKGGEDTGRRWPSTGWGTLGRNWAVDSSLLDCEKICVSCKPPGVWGFVTVA